MNSLVSVIKPYLYNINAIGAARMTMAISMLLIGLHVDAQKYDLINFNIEHGLVQSQIYSISEDRYGMLWIATLGGISRFDGKDFTNFNYGKGLVQSMTNTIYPDSQNRIWIGQESSIQQYDGHEFKRYSIASDEAWKNVADFTEAPDGSIYALIYGGHLFRLDDSSKSFTPVFKDLRFTSIVGNGSNLYASIYHRGIFKFDSGSWVPVLEWQGHDTTTIVKKLYIKKYSPGIWALTTAGIYDLHDDTHTMISVDIPSSIYCLEEDKTGALFAGTSSGVYKITSSATPEKIGLEQGLTDNAVRDIFTDHEGNIWFGTDGAGLFRYHDNMFRIFDHVSGLQGEVTMALAQDRHGNIWAGSLEGGLSKIKDGVIQHISLMHKKNELLKINCLMLDHAQKLWIGTIGSGLWTYDQNRFVNIGSDIKGFPKNFTSIYEAPDFTIWLTSPRGIHRIKEGIITYVSDIQHPGFISYAIGKDSILVGTTQGLYLIDKDLKSRPYPVAGGEGMLIGSIQPIGKYLALGTSENGVLIKEIASDKTWVCNESNGLSSNMVFSILHEGDALYAGTINGLNKLSFDHIHQRFTAQHLKSSNQRLGPECNQNSILKDTSGRIWLGTTKGIYIYDPLALSEDLPPKIFLKSVDIYSGSIDSSSMIHKTQSAWHWIPKDLLLEHSQNHLTFTVQGVHLSSPEELRYQYFLVGADTAFSPPKENPSVIYPNLSPGKYTFKARALIGTNVPIPSAPISYSFEIIPPYYQKTWFRLSMVGFLILLGALIQKYQIMLKTRQNRLVAEARKQEQIKIQQRTSEDLHDDLGNKITRLSLLTDILQTRLNEEDVDQKKLMHQIKDNIQGLYMGTKDIIWALAPNHNTLYEAISRVQYFGSELFQESTVHFKTNEIDPAFKTIKPPFEFSRNLIMVCKEALHNILKHAQAHHACMEFTYQHALHDELGTLKVTIKDDGMGFETSNSIKKGNGLDNMNKRINRIGGNLTITTSIPSGTEITIELKIPLSEG